MRTRRPKSSQHLLAARTPEEAALYDAHVVPRYSALFGRLLLAALPAGQRLQVLDIGCGTGYPALEVLRRLGEGGRVIAIDPDAALVDVARRRALEEANRRIFFKVEALEKLSFGDQVFDAVIGNLAMTALESPEDALVEMRRVLVPGGRLLLTQALAGTWEEVNDMFREIALRTDDAALASRLDRLSAHYPSASTLEAMVDAAGFHDITVTCEEVQLTFPSAADIFTDPALRFVALPEWRWVAGLSERSERILDEVRRSLDIYFGGGPLSLRVSAGLISARA